MSVSARLSRSTLVGATVLGLSLPLAAPASATFPGANGRISYQEVVCDEPTPGEFVCHSDIVSARPDGTGLHHVTNVGDEEFAVLSDWSADSSRIAYDVDDETSVQVWVANADGSGAMQVTTGPGFHGDPVWNPAGTQLAIDTDWNEYDTDPTQQGIWVVPVQAGVTKSDAVRQLTSVPAGSDFDSEPAWSPDGAWVAFTRFKSCRFREHGRQTGAPNGCVQAVFKVRSDGTGGLRQLTPWGMAASYPNWSPDGSMITFDSCDSGKAAGCRGDIWVMRADGSGKTRLTSSPPTGQLGSGNLFDLRNNPDFSPAGDAIVFTHWCADGGTELLTIPVAGGPESTVLGCDGLFRNKADWGSAA